MKMNSGLMGSETVEWETPDDLFNVLDREFNFNLDVCASSGMQKCARYFTPETDGLKQDWSGQRCWMNPPYGAEIKKWVKKASQIDGGGVVVGLLPNRTDTIWYKSWVEPFASEIRLISGRVKFKGGRSAAPFPSLIAIWGTPRTPRYGVIEYKGGK